MMILRNFELKRYCMDGGTQKMPICQELIFSSFIYDSYESIIFYLWQITETSSLSLSRLQSQDILVGPRPTIFSKGYFEGYFSATKISVVNLNVVTSLSKVHFRLRPTLFHVPCSLFRVPCSTISTIVK